MKLPLISIAAATLSLAPLHGQLLFDQDITPDVIFGSGNANGGWTVDQDMGIELGLRAKVRYDENGFPANVFNSNGDGTYDFLPGSYTASSRPDWNFEWSVNSNFDGSGGTLDTFTYRLSLDTDPSLGESFIGWDPINVASADHAFGDNSTPNGGGIVNEAIYPALIGTSNVAQNSWAYHWFDGGFDPYATGVYTIKLDAYDRLDGIWLAGTEIKVNVIAPVPEPSTIGLLSIAGLGAVIYVRRRRKARS